jgi:hypothetical protein
MDRVEKTITIVMKILLKGWSLMRILRLILGITILVQGIASKDAVIIILGMLFGGMAITNTGCCGSAGCAIDTSTQTKTKTADHEELADKK